MISQFNSGKSRLIVCTSVLEEGLDVAACDLVIRFSGVRSLIQFVQSRGRARKQTNSRFVVLINEEERTLLERVRDEEVILEAVLKAETISNQCVHVQIP